MRTQEEWLARINAWVFNKVVEQTQWIIFSGAPSSGKTTTAELLRDVHQFDVRDEISRTYINQLKTEMTEEVLIKKLNSFDFCQTMIQKKLDAEPYNSKRQLIIDSGLSEGYAYFQLLSPDEVSNKELDEVLTSRVAMHLKRYRYKLVFSFDMLPLVKDGVRMEEEPARLVLHNAFRNAYKQLGYQIIQVPVGSREARVAFVLNEIRRATAVLMHDDGLKKPSGVDRLGFYAPSRATQVQKPVPMNDAGLKNYAGGVRFWNELVGVRAPASPQVTTETSSEPVLAMN